MKKLRLRKGKLLEQCYTDQGRATTLKSLGCHLLMSLLHIQLRGLFNITRLHPGCLTILGKTTHSSFTAVPSIGYALSAIIYTQIMRAKSAKPMGRLLSAQCLLRSPELFYSIVSSFCHLILCSSDVLIHILSLTKVI